MDFLYLAIGFGFLYIGFLTKKGIYNLLSIPAFLGLALEVGTPGIVISMIGVSLINFYYVFWGNR
jgi:hypothetical protein